MPKFDKSIVKYEDQLFQKDNRWIFISRTKPKFYKAPHTKFRNKENITNCIIGIIMMIYVGCEQRIPIKIAQTKLVVKKKAERIYSSYIRKQNLQF